MKPITFDKLLLKTAFCCMASDGNIDNREISIIKSLCDNSNFFKDFDFQSEINKLVDEINNAGLKFILSYFDFLNKSNLTETEELTIIDFAIQTINADNQVLYSEIKFFKNIRHRLKVNDEKILEKFPDIEQYLEKDIINDNYLEIITNQFFEVSKLPQFNLIDITYKLDENSEIKTEK